MAGISKNATSEIVYKSLKEDILHLVLVPGSAISEIETAEKYNVSRTPVRDAFKALEKEGLLEVRPHIGTFISLIDIDKISNVFYMREVLEQAILHDLYLSSTPTDILKCRLVLEKQKTLIKADIDFIELGRLFIASDNEFHSSLFQICGKEGVWQYLLSINQQYERFRTLLNLEERNNIIKLYEEHKSILDCIDNKDEAKLKTLVKEHIYGGFNRCSEVICKYPDYFKQLSSTN